MKGKSSKKKKSRLRLLLIVVGTIVVVQPQLVAEALVERGYFAIGGEWLVFPLLCLLYMFIKDLICTTKEFERVTKIVFERNNDKGGITP